tara:strand:+ start:209 stop:622 length:414 start_codon:yes stop_codon:yes gene_type:complete
MMTKRLSVTAVVVLGVMLMVSPVVTGQASSLDSSEASAFMGTWVLTMETPRGANEQTVVIRDEAGEVAATLGGGRGGQIDISDIARDGESLVLAFERNFQGNAIDIVLTLSLDGEVINATQDIAGGQFSMTGSGKRQ